MNVGNCARARMMNPYLSKPQKEDGGVQSAFKLQFEQGMPSNGSDITSTGNSMERSHSNIAKILGMLV